MISVLMAAAIAPTLPRADEVFRSPMVIAETERNCATAVSPLACTASFDEESKRLVAAYDNPNTTPEQRYKLLVMIDDARSSGPIQWAQVATQYFAWRQLVTGNAKIPTPSRREPSNTVTTRCYNGRFSSSCTTTTN